MFFNISHLFIADGSGRMKHLSALSFYPESVSPESTSLLLFFSFFLYLLSVILILKIKNTMFFTFH
jgi:hypothetical protein